MNSNPDDGGGSREVRKRNDIIFTVSGCILDMHNIYLIPAKVWDTISELCD